MSTETNGLKTPLYDIHVESGGKIVPFAGYLLPVQYGTGVIAEHMAVRTKCGLFDVSHMGEIILKGPDALKNLNHLLTNDYTVMACGQARYSPMCNEEGGVVDDLIVYKVRDDCYFIVVNAANKDKDYAWMKAHVSGDAPALRHLRLRRPAGPAGPQSHGHFTEGGKGGGHPGEILHLQVPLHHRRHGLHHLQDRIHRRGRR